MKYAICYVSTAEKDLSPEEINHLLDQSKEKNNQKDIAGILLYSEGNFFQVLEGEKSEVLKIFELIQEDERHYNIIKIFGKEIPEKKYDGYEVDFISEHRRYSQERLQHYLYHIQGLDEASQKVVQEMLSLFIDSNK